MNYSSCTHTHRCVFNVWIFIQPNRLNLVKSHKCATWTWLNGEQAVIYISWLLYIYKYTWMDWQPQTHGIIIFPNGNWGVQYFWVKNTWENEGLKAVRTADRFIQTASERTRQSSLGLTWRVGLIRVPCESYFIFFCIHQETYDCAYLWAKRNRERTHSHRETGHYLSCWPNYCRNPVLVTWHLIINVLLLWIIL